MTRTRGRPGVTVARYMTATTILSPHPDDAVLSLWHVLAGPGEVAVVNVFAGRPAGSELGWWDALGDRGREVALYADLPHATHNGVPRWQPLSLNGARATEPPDVHSLSAAEAERKQEALERYRTQYHLLDERFSLSSRPEVLRYE